MANNEHIAVVMAWMAQRIMKAEGFILEQAPDVIQQIITMDFVQALSVALCLAMAVPFVVLMLWLGWKHGDYVVRALVVIIGGWLIAAMLVVSASNAAKAIRIHCATKAYLLERVGILK